jgi:hypothetical protein
VVTTRFVFVGERPSQRALAIGATWQNGKLAAKTLHEALVAAGLDPSAQWYFNLWPPQEAGWTPELSFCYTEAIFEALRMASAAGLPIVGLGQLVCRALSAAGIHHAPLTHPAARGLIRRTERYRAHVQDVLAAVQQ